MVKKEITYLKKLDLVSIKMVKETTIKYNEEDMVNKTISNSKDAYKLAKTYLEDKDREYFMVCCLNTKGKPINMSVASIGALNNSIASPREIFKTAILSNAMSIILFHNHPSGNCEPSPEDKDVTNRLKECGHILGIEVLDHIIIGDNNYKSFKELGLI